MTTSTVSADSPSTGPPPAPRARLQSRAAALSFTLGLIALRVCWLPGINCLLAVAALALGMWAVLQIVAAHGRLGGLEEALTGVVLGLVVLGLSVFFVAALVAAYPH